MSEFPKYLYHPIEAPRGALFETSEKTARLGPGWVSSPALFPKPRPHDGPVVGPQQARQLVQRQVDRGKALLATKESLGPGPYDAWQNTTLEVLALAFGRASGNNLAFKNAHAPVGIISGPKGWDHHIRHKGANQLEILASCLDQLDIEQSLGDDGPELDQKFGILLSPNSLSAQFASATANGRACCLMFVDLDGFKSLNTRFTESLVDAQLLRPLHARLRDLVASRGTAYKQGGDEFILLLPNHEAEEGLAFAERIRRTIESDTYTVDSQVVKLTASIGLAAWPTHGADLAAVQSAANQAEREAKKGKNRVCVAAG